MVTFKFENNYYTAYNQNEKGNPHSKGYPVIVKLLEESIIPTGKQRSIIKGYLKENNLDYHEVIHYAEKDINTHDLVKAIIKFHELKRI